MNFIVKMLMLAVLCSFPVSGMAHEVERIVICDTEYQTAQFSVFFEDATEKGALEAVAKVNAEHNKFSCVITEAAYVRGDLKATMVVDTGIGQITEILVLAIKIKDEWKRTEPFVQYTIFFIKVEDV